MDILNLSLVGLISFGFVNVVTFFKPDLDSRVKWALSFLAAFVATFIPAELGNVLLEHLKQALAVALATSGSYKMIQKLSE